MAPAVTAWPRPAMKSCWPNRTVGEASSAQRAGRTPNTGVPLGFLPTSLPDWMAAPKLLRCPQASWCVCLRSSSTVPRLPYRLLSGVGLGKPSTVPSQTALARALPMAVMTMRSSLGQSSRSKERTRDRWVPRLRWIPEHSMHIREPRLRLAQSGSEGSKTSGRQLISALTQQPLFYNPADPSLQAPAPQIPSQPSDPASTETRTPVWSVGDHGPVWQHGQYPVPDERVHCRRE